MSGMTQGGYEFTQDQNALIGGMASKMRGVGLFLVVIGVLNLLAAIVVVLAIYRAKLPQSYVDAAVKAAATASDTSQTKVKDALDKLPPDNHLWGVAIGTAVNGLIYLLVGVWTRSAAGSFRQIVDTRGNDIGHLMNALSSLNKMYALIYTLIMIGLLLLIAVVGLFIYAQFSR